MEEMEEMGKVRGYPIEPGADLADANLAGANLTRADLIGANLVGANLAGANLVGADLIGANLVGANLVGANLTRADLRGADLTGANLTDANLTGANLTDADLTGADLRGANLVGANLAGANLTRADLIGADLAGANLKGANLRGADLTDADLTDADLSQCAGLLDPIDYLAANFEKDPERGIIAYKTFNTNYKAPAAWKIEPGAVLSEVTNPCPTVDCASGINVATLKWVRDRRPGNSVPIWRCLLRWEWLPGVVVPYNTDSKIRCSRVELLEIVED